MTFVYYYAHIKNIFPVESISFNNVVHFSWFVFVFVSLAKTLKLVVVRGK